MAVLKMSEILKMDEKTKKSKLKDLKMELIKGQVSANKANSKSKEIKKAIKDLDPTKDTNVLLKDALSAMLR